MSRLNFDGDDDGFDSRDVDARLEELDAEIADLKRMIKGSPPDDYVMEREDLVEMKRERKALRALRRDVTHPDWPYGITFISDDTFEDYAREYAEDSGAIEIPDQWPFNHIDWEAAANALQQDFSQVEFRGTTYWHRS